MIVLPYAPENTSLCPSCGRPTTEYHPAERAGRCYDPPEGCGFRWRFEPYTVEVGRPWWWTGHG
jgi:hypothetical protein